MMMLFIKIAKFGYIYNTTEIRIPAIPEIILSSKKAMSAVCIKLQWYKSQI